MKTWKSLVLGAAVLASCGSDNESTTSSGATTASSTVANKISTLGIKSVESARNSDRAISSFIQSLSTDPVAGIKAVSAESTGCTSNGDYITSGTDTHDLAVVASSDKHGEQIWCAMTVDSANPEKFKGMLSKNLNILCALEVAIGGFTYGTSFTEHTDVSITFDSSNDCFDSDFLSNFDVSGTMSINVKEMDVSAETGSKWSYRLMIDTDKDGTYEQDLYLKDGSSDGMYAVKDIEWSGSNVKSLAEVVLDFTNGKTMFFSGETTDGNERSNRFYVEGSADTSTGEFSSVTTAQLVMTTGASGTYSGISMNYTSSDEAYQIYSSSTASNWGSNSGTPISIASETNYVHSSSSLDTYAGVTYRLDFSASDVTAAVSTLY